ncbi:hypothetical protein JRC04_05530 [Mycolicibacterium sp. S2-37]|uniref:hypothetical protein n=1 Tax=Mycolicibacterium sp. S2-37 TaxID=2810297 RepID=UPI001A944919|nr:hypothetical protein [Mycolicibacterium sp. S2-37]MBO0676917.1 hypothetical protein [Mycolicibacterium sp. S2-37]
MTAVFDPHYVCPSPTEAVWVQAVDGEFEIGVQVHEELFACTALSRELLEQLRDNIDVALTEALW